MVWRLRILPVFSVLTLSASQLALADEAQYRRIEMIDGAIHEGQILGSDGQSMDVLTPRGKVKLPMMDIINLTEMSQAEFDALMAEKIAWVGVRSVRSDQKKAAETVSANFQTNLKKLPWTQVTGGNSLSQALGPERSKALSRCVVDDLTCVSTALQGAPFDSFMFGVTEPVGDQVRTTFRLVGLESTSDPRQVSVVWRGNTLPADSSLLQAASVLRGVDIPANLVGTPPTETASGSAPPEKAPAEVKAPPAETPVATNTPPSTPPEEKPRQERGEPIPGAMYPLPGAPAIFAGKPEKLLPALGVVAAATGAAVYVVGGVGLDVPWTETQGTWADPLFLSGVGLVTYLATTLITNQIMSHTLEPATPAQAFYLEATPGGLTLRF